MSPSRRFSISFGTLFVRIKPRFVAARTLAHIAASPRALPCRLFHRREEEGDPTRGIEIYFNHSKRILIKPCIARSPPLPSPHSVLSSHSYVETNTQASWMEQALQYSLMDSLNHRHALYNDHEEAVLNAASLNQTRVCRDVPRNGNCCPSSLARSQLAAAGNSNPSAGELASHADKIRAEVRSDRNCFSCSFLKPFIACRFLTSKML